MCCCCFNLHRHQVHLISYGCVAAGLIVTGTIFTIFSIFYKDSEIGKVWLAGPTTMVVGLVLCGKVVIDWGPAMLHAREGSIDSALVEQVANPVLNVLEGDAPLSYPLEQMPYRANSNGDCPRHPRVHSYDGDIGQEGAIDCIVYSQYESTSNSNNSPYEKTANSLPLKYMYNKQPNDDLSPQSPLGPLRAKIGMLRGGTIGTQTSPPPHDKTMTGLPVIKPRLINSFNQVPQSTLPQNQFNYSPNNNNTSMYNHQQPPQQQRGLNNSSFSHNHQQQTFFPANPRSPIEYESLECNCNSNNRQYYRTVSGQIHDYGSMHRESQTMPRQHLYQGETFVLNEKSYFI